MASAPATPPRPAAGGGPAAGARRPGPGAPSRAGEPGTSALWRGPRFGTVVAFDERRGLGAVEDQHGVRTGFHCTAIADGTRRIAVGTPVTFVLAPGHHGRMEAQALHPLGPPAP